MLRLGVSREKPPLSVIPAMLSNKLKEIRPSQLVNLRKGNTSEMWRVIEQDPAAYQQTAIVEQSSARLTAESAEAEIEELSEN